MMRGLALRPDALLPGTKWIEGIWTPKLVWTPRRRWKSLATAGNGTMAPRPSPYRVSYPSSWPPILLRPPSSHLRLDLPSAIFPSDFPVIFCIPSHPPYFRIWFQSHVTSSFMNGHIANKMATFRNLHNSSTRFQHYYTAGLQTNLLSKCAHNICFPLHFRRNMTSVGAGLLRIGQVCLR